jgi:hypothetical protein
MACKVALRSLAAVPTAAWDVNGLTIVAASAGGTRSAAGARDGAHRHDRRPGSAADQSIGEQRDRSADPVTVTAQDRPARPPDRANKPVLRATSPGADAHEPGLHDGVDGGHRPRGSGAGAAAGGARDRPRARPRLSAPGTVHRQPRHRTRGRRGGRPGSRESRCLGGGATCDPGTAHNPAVLVQPGHPHAAAIGNTLATAAVLTAIFQFGCANRLGGPTGSVSVLFHMSLFAAPVRAVHGLRGSPGQPDRGPGARR